MKKLDLAWGNPGFLYNIWNNVPMEEPLNNRPGDYVVGSSFDLKMQIRALHKKVHGEVKGSIVIGAGATQVIQAAIWAMNELNEEDTAKVYAKPPYYSRFPVMAKLAGAQWCSQPRFANIQIITSPNNPDGELVPGEIYCKRKIYDYSYNWPQYLAGEVRPLDKAVMCFSIAKATGHADMRIGWAIVKDEKLAKKMEEYIELSTMGVSKQAQEAAFDVLCTVTDHHIQFFTGAKAKLASRWLLVKDVEENLPFEVLNTHGMFLYCKGECPKNIKSINGQELGDKGDRFRLNIGCSDEQFNEFISRYNKNGRK